MVTMNHRLKGRLAEWAALMLLVVKGYRIRQRNWRAAGGELDLIAEQRGEVVFVEVKMRSSSLFGGAGAAVDLKKQRTMMRVASAYLSRFELWDRPCRYDIVTVEARSRFPFWTIRHFRDAFSSDLGRQL